MAEFALGLTKTAVEGAVSRVKSAIDEEAKLKVRVQNDLVFITGEFQMMQSFLNVANKERAKNEVVRTWVRQIRELAFDVEDCVELVVSLDIKSGWSWLWRVLPGCVAPPRPIDDAVAEIERLKARVEDVSHRNARYNLIGDSGTGSKSTTLETVVSKSPAPYLMHNSSSAFHTLREVWKAAGKMQHDFDDLKKLLTKQGRDLEVISLWGSSGSTVDLATSIIRKAYNDPKICEEFKIRAWIKMMHPFNLDEFFKSLLTQFYASSHQAKVLGAEFRGKMRAAAGRGEDLMKAQLIQQVSEEQRYLVIVEPFSTMAEWDAIRMYLPDSEKGSRIVVVVQQLGLALSCTGEPYQVAELGHFSDGRSLCAFFSKPHIEEPEPMGDSVGLTLPDRGFSPGRFGALASPEETDIDESDEEMPSTSQVMDGKNVKLQLAKFLSLNPLLVPGADPKERDEERSRLLRRYFSSRMVEAFKWITETGLIGHHNEWRKLCSKLDKGVFSVWGIAGAGKSALVRSIYYNNMIGINQNHLGAGRQFCGILSDVTKHSWVDVPYPFSLTDLSRRLLLDFHSDDVDDKETEAISIIEGLDPIQRCRKFLRQECCFVVIDGLCSTDDWGYIEDAFLSEPIKGCIIVITNEEKVAAHCADKEDKVINVKGLEADVALNVFSKPLRRNATPAVLRCGAISDEAHTLTTAAGG